MNTLIVLGILAVGAFLFFKFGKSGRKKSEAKAITADYIEKINRRHRDGD